MTAKFRSISDKLLKVLNKNYDIHRSFSYRFTDKSQAGAKKVTGEAQKFYSRSNRNQECLKFNAMGID